LKHETTTVCVLG